MFYSAGVLRRPCEGAFFASKKFIKFEVMGAISSIHFEGVKENSEGHNKRLNQNLDYIYDDLSYLNSNIIFPENIDFGVTNSEHIKFLQEIVKTKTGRKAQAKSHMLQEGVFNFSEHHTDKEIQHGIQDFCTRMKLVPIRLSIHRDEGRKKLNPDGTRNMNLHAHLTVEWVNRETGKSHRWSKETASECQTVLAECLGMERGELKSKTGLIHLDALAYKVQAQANELQLKEQEQKQINEKIQKEKQNVTETNEKLKQEKARNNQLENEIKKLTEKLESDLKESNAKISNLRGQKSIIDAETGKLLEVENKWLKTAENAIDRLFEIRNSTYGQILVEGLSSKDGTISKIFSDAFRKMKDLNPEKDKKASEINDEIRLLKANQNKIKTDIQKRRGPKM